MCFWGLPPPPRSVCQFIFSDTPLHFLQKGARMTQRGPRVDVGGSAGTPRKYRLVAAARVRMKGGSLPLQWKSTCEKQRACRPDAPVKKFQTLPLGLPSSPCGNCPLRGFFSLPLLAAEVDRKQNRKWYNGCRLECFSYAQLLLIWPLRLGTGRRRRSWHAWHHCVLSWYRRVKYFVISLAEARRSVQVTAHVMCLSAQLRWVFVCLNGWLA